MSDAVDVLAAAAGHAFPAAPELPAAFHFEPGGTWVLDAPDHVPAVWGKGNEVLWAQGEPCYIVGVTGVGKTTIAAQLVFARVGLLGDVLGYPVAQTQGRVLVLASDRPRQAQRAYGRLAEPAHRDALNDRLAVWQGPPLRTLADEPEMLLQMCHAARADTVVLDSLINMVGGGLSDETVVGGLNRAVQLAIRDEIEVLGLHHMTKAAASSGTPQIEGVFGSTFVTANAGSVLVLSGRPGASSITLHHVKQPADEVGPLSLSHDHATGRTAVVGAPDLAFIIEARGNPAGMTATEVAAEVFGVPDPTDGQKKKIKRQLQSLVKTGTLVVDKGRAGGAGGAAGDRYRSVTAPLP